MIELNVLHMLVFLACFGVPLILGTPISYSIGIAATAALLLSLPADIAFTSTAQRMAAGLDSFALLAIPFFILAGQLMNRGGIARRLIAFARVLVGGLPGGLAAVNVTACLLFGAVSGSAVAAAAAIGGALTPMMKREGYDPAFAAAVNITSSTTGLIVPPSNILIIYSLASGGVSIAALFLAGYLPGLLIALALILTAAVMAKRRGYGRAANLELREALRAFANAAPSMFLIVVVIGGIVAGWFTATEASAAAVVYTFVLSVLIYREISWRELPELLRESAAVTSVVLLLIACSSALAWTLAYERLPENLSTALLAWSDNPIIILLMMNLILLIVGAFLDITPAVLIFTPVFLPVVRELGVDPVHFGIMMILNLSIGICTPPVGSVLFVGCSTAGVPLERVVRPMLPLFAAMLVVLGITALVPELSLLLPRWFGYLD